MHLKGYDPCTRFDFGVLISTPGSAGPVHDSGLENGNLPLSNAVAYNWLEEAIQTAVL